MDPGCLPITLSIPCDLRLLDLARGFVDSVGRLEGDSTLNTVVLATNEATSNAIRHAHRDQPDAIDSDSILTWPRGPRITLLDEGLPFDLASVPILDPSEIRVGGHGIFFDSVADR